MNAFDAKTVITDEFDVDDLSDSNDNNDGVPDNIVMAQVRDDHDCAPVMSSLSVTPVVSVMLS